jgi:putative Mg2+ transporter-C (MgtC) family protein
MTQEFVLRIFIAALLGGAIGLEREYRAKEAGLRTHFLVGMGAALFMLMSMYGYGDVVGKPGYRVDPSRVAAQVVSGIGFIGAGTIIFQRHIVRGLTTAAGLWVTAAIGLTCGSGMYMLATAATVLVLLCLEAMNFVLHRFGARNIVVTFLAASHEATADLLKQLGADGFSVTSYEMKEKHTAQGDLSEVSMELKVKRDKYESQIVRLMGHLNGMTVERIE